MIGITSIGAYVPAMRLDKGAIAKHFRGEKAVANFDEDAITMAVAAGMSALDDATRSEIGALYFASASSPYREKTAATLIGSAIDLPERSGQWILPIPPEAEQVQSLLPSTVSRQGQQKRPWSLPRICGEPSPAQIMNRTLETAQPVWLSATQMWPYLLKTVIPYPVK